MNAAALVFAEFERSSVRDTAARRRNVRPAMQGGDHRAQVPVPRAGAGLVEVGAVAPRALGAGGLTVPPAVPASTENQQHPK